MDELALAERLIAYDTSKDDGLRAAAEFVKGWLEARELRVESREHEGLPLIIAEAGPPTGPLVVLHGHLDVSPYPISKTCLPSSTKGMECMATSPLLRKQPC
jgi:succinyl-diaminopimelate desuccinylase